MNNLNNQIFNKSNFTACLYTMRTISLLCTQLPPGYIDNNKRCRSRNNHTGQKWDIIAWRVLSQAGKFGFQVLIKTSLPNILRILICKLFLFFLKSFSIKVISLKALEKESHLIVIIHSTFLSSLCIL